MSDKIVYRKNKGKQLTSAEVDGNFKFLDSKIDKVSQVDYFIKDAGYSIIDTQITINSGSKWLFNGVEYSNGVDFIFEVSRASVGNYRVDIVSVNSSGDFDLIQGEESSGGYSMPLIGNNLPYLYLYISDKGIQNASNDTAGDYVSKLSYGWVQVDLKQSELPVSGLNGNIEIVGGNLIIDNIANGIKSIKVNDEFPDGYEVSIRNSRTSYLTIVNSPILRVYTGRNYTVRPGEIIVFKYDKSNKSFSVSGGLDIGIDMDNIDEVLGVDVMRMYIDSSAGDALNPNDLNTTLTPNVMRYFKDYNHQAVGWQWRRYTGNSQADQDADAAWSVGKTKRVLGLTPADFTDAINKGNVSFMAECVVNSQTITGVWVGKLVDQAKTIRIESTGTQFKGVKPEYIILKAIVNNFQPTKIEWLKDGNLVNISNSFLVYQNQVDSFAVYTLKVTDVKGNIYTDAITISKVVDGKDGQNGEAGAVPVWTEWMTGDIHYNNDEQVFYIYHRPTESVWKLKPGYANVVAPANPDDRYVRQPHLEQVVTRVLVAEGANIAGFIFKNGKLISQYPNLDNPNISIDGNTGKAIFRDAEFTGKVTILPGSPAIDTINNAVKDGLDAIEVGGRNLFLLRNQVKNSLFVKPYGFKYNENVYSVSPVIFQEGLDVVFQKGDTISISYDIKVKLSKIGTVECAIRLSNFLEGRLTTYAYVYPEIIDAKSDQWYSCKHKIKIAYDCKLWAFQLYNHKWGGDAENYYFNSEVEYKNIKVERGDKVTDFTEAPEDVYDRILDQEIYIEYSVDGKGGWHFPYREGDKFMRQKKGNGTWSGAMPFGKDGLQGLQGKDGSQGIPGAKGADGRTSYTHIAYADTSTGGGFSQVPGSKTYIGMYVDFVATDSTDPSKYKWSLIKGANGAQGVPGKAGVDGKTPYFHTAWATNANGTSGFSTTVSAGKTHIGTYTDFTQGDSTNPALYKWSQIKGDKGETGAKGDKGATGATGPKGVDGLNGEPLGDGVDLFPDNDFRYGSNGTGGYAGANASTLVRIAKSADAPTLSGFMRRVINNGTIVDSDNRRGGFVQYVTSRASAVFIHKIIAKIPVGHTIRDYNNQTGNGRVVTWLTSQQGTGKFELYMYKHRCGVGGTFSSFGHVAFLGPAGTSSAPVYYDIALSTIYDMSTPDRRFDFLTTTIDGNSIATGTLRVGQGNVDTAGITGVRDSGESSNVAFWAGVGFGNRKTAPFRVDTNGSLFATRANISGAINATSGYFGGFKITLNSFESVNGAYRVESATGMQILRDKNGKVRNMRGLNENGEPVDTWYDEDGNETMTWSSKGVMYPGFIKESYTKYSYYKISALTVAGVTPFFSALRKKQGGAWTDGQPKGPYSEFQYTTDGVAPGTQNGYTYNAGNNPESENNKKYEGFYYTSENKLGSKIADGWYVSHKVFTRTYGQLRDFNSPNPSMPNMIVTSPFYDETFTVVRFQGGKIVESRSCKGRLDMNYPSASSVEVAVPYSAVSVI